MTNTGFHVEREGSEIVLSIEVPPDEVKKKEQEFLAAARAQLKVPGFRPGKAPEHLVLRQYGEDEFASDLKDDLIREWLGRALGELHLHPVTTPNIETTAFARGARFSFQVKFAVLPEVEIPDELTVDVPEPPPVTVTEEQVQSVLAEMRREAAALEPKDGPAEEGDVVRLARAGRGWEGEATASRPLGKQLLGAQAGTRIALVNADGQSEMFSVITVYQVLLPTLDEAAWHYGYPSWDAFTDGVRQRVVRIEEGRRTRAWRQAALDAVADACQVEVPPTLLAEVVADEMKELDVHPDEKPQLEEVARRKLRREIVAKRVAEAKGLHPDEDEVTRLIEEQGQEERVVRAMFALDLAADWIIAQTRRGT